MRNGAIDGDLLHLAGNLGQRGRETCPRDASDADAALRIALAGNTDAADAEAAAALRACRARLIEGHPAHAGQTDVPDVAIARLDAFGYRRYLHALLSAGITGGTREECGC